VILRLAQAALTAVLVFSLAFHFFGSGPTAVDLGFLIVLATGSLASIVMVEVQIRLGA
jgi:hypothetical protein